MTATLAAFGFDVLMSGLLIAAIAYCIKLNRRIGELQNSRGELAKYIQQFDESTTRATATLMEIQNASKKITQNIDVKLEKANYLADDLTFLVERGTKLARQLEAASQTPQPAAATPKMTPLPSAAPRPAEKPAAPTPKPETALEALLKKMSTKPAAAPGLQSQAEKDLYEAVKSFKEVA